MTEHLKTYGFSEVKKIKTSKMNQIKTLLLLLALMPTWACAINRPTSIFMFGFCTSFNDSTVYLTDIQQVDSAWIDTKTDFLYSRDNYSFQLRDYMKEHQK